MAIAIVPGSGKITTHRSGQPKRPALKDGRVDFSTASEMYAEGEVQFSGGAGDKRDGWQVGWIQVQWVETNWAEYRGQFDRDGSLFLQRGRPPARPLVACRDGRGNVSKIFMYTDELQTIPTGSLPATVITEVNDGPTEFFSQIETNSLTRAPNFVHEIQMEMHFCTVLSVRDPDNQFHHQVHFYWYLHWQNRFHPTAFPAPSDDQWTVTPAGGGNRGHASAVFAGAPNDPRVTPVLTSSQAFSCFDLATRSAEAVAK
ncbi:MAG: hypothetical protein ACHQF3_05980, partial [Alphaproteobacteria bacterium]